MKTIIMAGGRGTRISELFPDIPKPMIPIEGIPVLEREICSLRDQGFNDIILTVSYKASIIQKCFGNGNRLGVRISYFVENYPMGNAGALFKMREEIGKDDFLLLNADSVFDVDFNKMVEFHRFHNALVTLFTHPNNHPFDSALIFADNNGCVKKWLGKEEQRPQYYKNRVNAGLHVVSPKVLDMVDVDIRKIEEGKKSKIDLDRQVLKPMCSSGRVFCYDSPEYVKDMGTPERYIAVCSDYKSGLVAGKNLKNKQRAIFLDRDGTINKYVGFLKREEEYELLPGVPEAVRKINSSGYLAIVCTNQPVVARGEVTFAELENIHNKMETLLGIEGAYLDGIYFCPHHPHKGYEGEIVELKVKCKCRKPEPGLLLKAAEDFNIDLCNSWVIGDGENDIKAGKAAGCRTALIGKGSFGEDMCVNSLLEAVERIFQKTGY